MSAVPDQVGNDLSRWDIPDDWTWVTLADVGEISTGNTPPKKDSSNYGDFIPLVKPPELQNKPIRTATDGLSKKGMKKARTLPEGAVLVSCIGGLGKIGLAKVPVAFNQQINAIVFDGRVIPEYGYYYAQTLKPWLYGVASATTLPIVNKGKFQKAPFPLAPRGQQERIVAEIEKQFSRLDEAVASLKRVKANLKRYKAAVLKAAVEGKLTEEWRKQNPDVEPASKLLERILGERRTKWEETELAKMKAKGKEPKDDRWKEKYKEPLVPLDADLAKLAADLPISWTWASADQLTNMVTDGEHATPPRTDEGVYLLSARNVQDGWLSLEKVDFISHETHKKLQQRLKVLPGDVLLSCSGTVGRSCVAPDDVEFSLVRSAAVLKPVLQMGQYMSYALRSLTLQVQINEKKSQTAQANIFQGKIKTLVFPLPPIAEQKELLEQVENSFQIISHVEKDIDDQLLRAERCRQAILASMFSGFDV